MASNTGRPHPLASVQEKEARYLEWGKEHPDLIYPASPDSVQGGFFRPQARQADTRTSSSKSTEQAPAVKPPDRPAPLMGDTTDTMQDMRKGMIQSWEDIKPYFTQLEPTKFETRPGLWDELNRFVSKNWNDVRIGFTELPQQMIFREKFTLFRYALVASQEMKKDKIDLAPDIQSGQEVMRVYASLGLVVNEIARWLRTQGLRCQSNHPMGGLVNTPSLAGKAGMGWQWRSGMMVTPEYGIRVRLAPVFVEHKCFEFTDNRAHDWIEEYCELCRNCERECPSQAISSQKMVNVDNVPGIGAIQTCISREKCLETFTKTMGCCICIKVCPFSKGDGTYEQLKAVVEQK